MVRGECSSAIDLRIRLSVESAALRHHLGDPFRPTLIPSHKRKRIPVLLSPTPDEGDKAGYYHRGYLSCSTCPRGFIYCVFSFHIKKILFLLFNGLIVLQ